MEKDNVFTITGQCKNSSHLIAYAMRCKDGSHLIASSHPLTDQDIRKVFLGLGEVTSIKVEPSTIGYAYKVRYTPRKDDTCTPAKRSSGAT